MYLSQLTKTYSVIISLSVILLVLTFFTKCVPVYNPYKTVDENNEPRKKIKYETAIYEKDIKTVQLYPTRNRLTEVAQPSVIPFDQRERMVLNFDHLYHDVEDFRVRFIHCNADWKPSAFKSIDILQNYNEFRIERYEQSFNTRVPYIHYTFNLPRFKIPGNYLLIVYRGNNTEDLLLTSRMMVVDNMLGISPNMGLSSSVEGRKGNQQLDFSINYGNIEVTNPLEEIHVVIRQNRRWDNAITDLKPNFVKDFQKELNYELFDLKNNFKGGNEFRFFDLRSATFPGQNVNNIDFNENEVKANLMIDTDRSKEAYTSIQDLNGAYIVEKVDANNADIESDYVTVNFFLKSPKLEKGELYILGEMNNWQHVARNAMIYNEDFKGYLGQQFLKQGWYNYIYYLDNASNNDPYRYDGSYFETENLYEFFVYFRGIGSRGDLLVGYLRINPNNLR